MVELKDIENSDIYYYDNSNGCFYSAERCIGYIGDKNRIFDYFKDKRFFKYEARNGFIFYNLDGIKGFLLIQNSSEIGNFKLEDLRILYVFFKDEDYMKVIPGTPIFQYGYKITGKVIEDYKKMLTDEEQLAIELSKITMRSQDMARTILAKRNYSFLEIVHGALL